MTFVPFISRNPHPARGRDVLTITQLRHYLRKIWRERRYGVCHIHGGRAAFMRFCGIEWKWLIITRLLPEVSESEYLSARAQRILSRKVLQLLRGEVIFVDDGHGKATWRPVLGRKEPPVAADIRPPDHEFRIEHTAIGPKIRRL